MQIGHARRPRGVYIRMGRWTALLFLPAFCWGADAPPEFTPEGLVRGVTHVHILVPGANRMSIYGENLGPFGGCIGPQASRNS